MSITSELREWWVRKFPIMDKELHKDFTAIADRIDAEHERAEQDLIDANNQMEQLCECSVELPKDADGEPIHAGDVLDGYGKTIEVVELRIGRSGWVLISRDGNGYADTFAFTHHAPTVEDVLREMLYKAHIYDEREMELLPDLIADYAKLLTLAEGEDA